MTRVLAILLSTTIPHFAMAAYTCTLQHYTEDSSVEIIPSFVLPDDSDDPPRQVNGVIWDIKSAAGIVHVEVRDTSGKVLYSYQQRPGRGTVGIGVPGAQQMLACTAPPSEEAQTVGVPAVKQH
jgi:hypothetical protein